METHTLVSFSSAEDIPRLVADQIRLALQQEWPDPQSPNTGQWVIEEDLHPTSFLLVDGNHLLSHARTIWLPVIHRTQMLTLHGLGDVLTVPRHRRKGYADRVVREATAHIRSSQGADAAVLLTPPHLAELYRRNGWECVPGLHVSV